MKIKKIAIRNLNSLRGDSALDFADRPLAHTGLFAIIGETGAGKSTILDAITLALYGKMPRNKNVKEVLSYGAVEALAEVEFEHNGQVFQAKWSLWRSHGKLDGRVQEPKRELSKWNAAVSEFEIIAEKVREVDEQVEACTGLDYDRFRRSVLLAQGDFAAFLDADEKERSELLEKITGTEVYSLLSKASFDRHKLEKDMLDRLKMEMEALRMLTREELELVRQQLNAVQKESKDFKQQQEEKNSQLGIFVKIESLEKKEHHLTTILQQLEEERKELQMDFDLLKNYEKAKVFLQELSILDERVANLVHTENELDRQDRQLLELQQRQQQSAALNREANQELVQQRDEFRRMEPRWLKVRELDKSLERQQKLVRELQVEQQTLQKEQENIDQHFILTSDTLQREEEQYEQLKKWLAENKSLERLQGNLSGLSHQIREWKEARTDLNSMQAEREKLEKNLAQQEREIQQLDQGLQEDKSNIDELQSQLKQQMPKNYALKENQLLELVHQELESLSAQLGELEKLRRKNEEYRQLLREEEACQDELESLRTLEGQLFKELMTIMSLHDDYQALLDYKTAIYEQQRLIVNYEKDRAELKEGEPCPLCFSTEHPFRKQNIKPFVNQAREDYEKARRQFEKTEAEYRKLQTAQQKLFLQIEQWTQRSERQRRLILEWEENFQQVLEQAQQQGVQLYNLAALNQKIAENQIQQSTLKKQKGELGSLLRKLEKLKEGFSLKDDQLRERKGEFRILQSEYKNRLKQVEGQEKRVANLKIQINKELKQFGLSIEKQQPDALLKKLTAWRDEFGEKGRQKVELERRLGILHKELEQIRREQRKTGDILQKKEVVVEQEKQRFESWQTSRIELLSDKNPDQEKQLFLERLEQLEAKRDEARNALEQVQREIESALAIQRKDTIALHRLRELKKEQEENLLSGIQKIGLSGIDDLRAINLTEEQVEAIRKRKEELDQQLIENRKLLQDAVQERKQLRNKVNGWPEPEDLRSQLRDLEEQYSNCLKQEGALQDQIRQDERQKATAKGLVKRLEQQKKEYQRWAKLNEIIGMSDGKKFRIFAQALTLEKLILLANQHLQQLNGRYVIEKLKGDDLSLEIVDTYQANHRRSMHTLSGGERFLVSLALALGLSDLAGRQSQIQSLFIDEGFGTLDDNSLDLVLTTLENLQSSGKTIGVISHVKELKERIATQIQLIRQENGFSKLKIVG